MLSSIFLYYIVIHYHIFHLLAENLIKIVHMNIVPKYHYKAIMIKFFSGKDGMVKMLDNIVVPRTIAVL